MPTVRQVAVELQINPNTVLRAYRELEIRGVLDTQQGTGTFIADRTSTEDEAERTRRLEQLILDVIARAGAGGFTLREVTEGLQQKLDESEPERGQNNAQSCKSS
ncbi:MAG: GntR family transcriptional regulator [Acidobacteriota bacterium]